MEYFVAKFRGYLRGISSSNDVAQGITRGLALAAIIWLAAFNLGLVYYLR